MTDILALIKESDKNLFVGLAGPGTGKSTAFKTIIDSDQYRGKKILILSFIKKLIKDLESDFEDYKNVEVSTLHSFAKKEIDKHIKTAVDLDENLDKIISYDYAYLEGAPIEFDKKLFTGKLSQSEEKFYKERAAFYSRGKALYSFNSVIYAINRIFGRDEKKIPAQYDLILIDEVQDFNQLEFDFIAYLNSSNRIMLVGDDDQSLYGWKNAVPQLIRDLYNNVDSDEFTLDYCYRCTEVIVSAVNDLILNTKTDGFLAERLDTKKFKYPSGNKAKDEISSKFKHIDFIPAVSGSQLFYQLASRIKSDTADDISKRVLVLVPAYYKQKMYEGLVKERLNVVEFELFSDEKHLKFKHKYIVDCFEVLDVRKTDNLALRKILHYYLSKAAIEELIKKGCKLKTLWGCLDDDTKKLIESDINLFRKVRTGKLVLTTKELNRLSKIFNLKNVLSKMIKGFGAHTKGALEIEITTVMSSKGLSADFVYFVGVDNYVMYDQESGKLTNHGICEFLVGLTRAKEKVTLFSFKENSPKFVEYIGKHVKTISVNT